MDGDDTQQGYSSPITPPEKEEGVSLGAGVDIVSQGSNEDVDDIEIESYNDDINLGGSLTPEEKLKQMRIKLKECAKERQEYLDGWQRLKADFANYKKREEEGKNDFLKFAKEDLVTELLPVLESFHMAFANKEAWEKVDSAWRTGVEHIHTQLLQALATHGLTEVDPMGEDFNPNEQTAIATVPTSDPKLYHKIAEVVQLGYKLSDKLIRSPRVKIYGEAGDHATNGGS